MNKEFVSKDENGVLRCYGIGETRQTAMSECIAASKSYLKTRPDIKVLYLFDNYDKPVIDPAQWSQWEIKL